MVLLNNCQTKKPFFLLNFTFTSAMKIKEALNDITEIHFLQKFIFPQISASFSLLITHQELAMTFSRSSTLIMDSLVIFINYRNACS